MATPFEFSFTINAVEPPPGKDTNGNDTDYQNIEGAIAVHEAEWKAALTARAAAGNAPPHALAEIIRQACIKIVRDAAATGPWADWPRAIGSIKVSCDLAPKRDEAPPALKYRKV